MAMNRLLLIFFTFIGLNGNLIFSKRAMNERFNNFSSFLAHYFFCKITIFKNKLLVLVLAIFAQTFFSFSYSQCVTVNAGVDQTICSGSANLTMTYTPVKATTSYTVAATTYSWNSTAVTTGTAALATNVDDVYSALIPIGFLCTIYYPSL